MYHWHRVELEQSLKQVEALQGELDRLRALASVEDSSWGDEQWRTAIKGILAGVPSSPQQEVSSE
jgi:hypothetical protein